MMEAGVYCFRPLSGNHYFKWEKEKLYEKKDWEGVRPLSEIMKRVSVPYRGIIISNKVKYHIDDADMVFPSPIGESLFQMLFPDSLDSPNASFRPLSGNHYFKSCFTSLLR